MKKPKTTDEVSSRKIEKAFMQNKMPANPPRQWREQGVPIEIMMNQA